MPKPSETAARSPARHSGTPPGPDVAEVAEVARPARLDATDQARALLAACGLSAGPTPRPGDPLEPALEWARSGAMALTGAATGRPRFCAGPLAWAMRAAAAALAALAPGTALARLDGPALLGERAALAGLARDGRRSAGGHARLLATRTGWIAVHLPRPDDWSLVPAWLEGPDAWAAGDWSPLERSVATRAGDALVERGRLMGLAVAPAPLAPLAERPLFRLRRESRGEPRPPGRRVRVLDLSALWAGPLAAGLLARAGAEVLKIESPRRPDGARSGPSDFFDVLNADKQAWALDLQAGPDRAVFDALLEQADVVIESARPRALAGLGVDPLRWLAGRAGRLWVSITGYGREHEWIAFGDDAAIAAGLGFPPDTDPAAPGPCFCGDAIADPITGLHAATLALGHLRAGRGGLLELSLRDVVAHLAALEAGPLERPRIARPDLALGAVGDVERPVPIEPPRARPASGRAPALQPPDAAQIARWIRPC